MNSSSIPSTSSSSTTIHDKEYDALLYQQDYVEALRYFLSDAHLINDAIIKRQGITHLVLVDIFYDIESLLKMNEFDEEGNLDPSLPRHSEICVPLKKDPKIGIDTGRFFDEASGHTNDWSAIIFSAVMFRASDEVGKKVIDWRGSYLPRPVTPRMRKSMTTAIEHIQTKIGKLSLEAPNQYQLSAASTEKLKIILEELIEEQNACLPKLSIGKQQWEHDVHNLFAKIKKPNIEIITSEEKNQEEILTLDSRNLNFTYLSFNMLMTQNIIAIANYWIRFLKNDAYWQIQNETSANGKITGYKLKFIESISEKSSTSIREKPIHSDIKKLRKIIDDFENGHPEWQLGEPHVAVNLIIELQKKVKTFKISMAETKSHKEVCRRLRTPLFLRADGSCRLLDLPRERERLVTFIATRKNISWSLKKELLSTDPFYHKSEQQFRAEVDRKLGKSTRNNLKK